MNRSRSDGGMTRTLFDRNISNRPNSALSGASRARLLATHNSSRPLPLTSASAIVNAAYFVRVPADSVASANVPFPLFVKHNTPAPLVLINRSSEPSPLTSAKTAPRQIWLVQLIPDKAVTSLNLNPPRFL